MTNHEIKKAYASQTHDVEQLLGTAVSESDPDRAVIEPWADTVKGSLLDVGSGTGRWTGHLARLGHEIEGLEPVESLVETSRRTFPVVPFRRGSIEDLAETPHRWAGILAWYSLIHMGPHQLSEALSILRGALQDNGTFLMSFFSGPHLVPFDHPVAVAYLWPMQEMKRALVKAGFEVEAQSWAPSGPHTWITAQVAS